MLRPREPGQRPLAVEVEGLYKSFHLASHRADTLKERMLHPLAQREQRTMEVLRDISFSVAQGEFFGIVGRNGSGKTTLLKLLASIYRADRGRIRVAGTLAPFIELGVGFNMNFTARDNVLINGVMMGLSPREARRRFDEVIEFAELEDFVELKLKNYSSGMSMRLAFAVMVQAQADVMLVDEVLAVGDAAFASKCVDTFTRLREEGKTILFVSHDMDSVRSLCHRALLIDAGEIEVEGDPDDVARRYFQINFRNAAQASDHLPGDNGKAVPAGSEGRIKRVWVEDPSGARVAGLEHGVPFTVVFEVEASSDIDQPMLSFDISATDGTRVSAAPDQDLGGESGRMRSGEVARLRATVSNLLAPGAYEVNCIFSRNGTVFDVVDLVRHAGSLTVWGAEQQGLVTLDYECEVETIDAREHAEATE